MDEVIMVSDDSGDTEAFYPRASYGDGREEEEEEESPTSEGEAERSQMGMDGHDSQDPGDPHFAGLRGGLWSPRPGESRRCYQPTSPQGYLGYPHKGHMRTNLNPHPHAQHLKPAKVAAQESDSA